jgi:N-acetylglucosamine kinase-like BadF-type ATPase
LLGDEGSGYRIALAALQAIAKAADGRGAATALTDAFLEYLKIETPKGLIQTIYRAEWDRAALAGLAPVVFAQADAGDGVAWQIVQEAAEQLAQMAAAVMRQLGWQGPVPLALAGGCLLASGSYQQRVVECTQALGLEIRPIQTVAMPAAGAVTLARATAQKMEK